MLIEKTPGLIQHLVNFNVYVDSQQFFGVVLSKVKSSFIILCQIETIFQLCSGIRCIGKKANCSIHYLRMILSCFLTNNQLFQPGKTTERINNYLTNIGVVS